MHRIPQLLLALAMMVSAAAQNRSVIPAACTELPGNAALSLPLRWTHGTLQVRIDSTLLPAGFLGKTISGLRLRRPAFLHEPAYPAVQRTLTVRGGFDTLAAVNHVQSLLPNRPAVFPVLFGPAPVTVAATPTQPSGASTGAEFLVIAFTTPLLVIAGNLLLKFETSDPPFQVDATPWVDAVWFPGGVETGYAVTLGNGSCTTRTPPTELVWNNASQGPRVGGTASLRLTGAPPSTFLFTWVGFDPVPRAAAPDYMGFGGSLTALSPGLAGCHQWSPLDGVWSGTSDLGGSYSTSFALVAGVTTIGLRLGAQSAWLDPTRPGLPISVSNGVMLVLDNIDVGTRCVTAFFPGSATWSPWPPFLGQMPVMIFDHN